MSLPPSPMVAALPQNMVARKAASQRRSGVRLTPFQAQERAVEAQVEEYQEWYEFFLTWGTLGPDEAHAKATNLAMCGLPPVLKQDRHARPAAALPTARAA